MAEGGPGLAPPALEARRLGGKRWRAPIAILIAAVIIVAGVSLYEVFRAQGATTALTPDVPGLAALQMVEAALSRVSSQNWTPFSDLGIASLTPYTPGIMGNQSGVVGADNSSEANLKAMWACESLPFPSVWNASGLPARSGNITDGYAPFWQFLLWNVSAVGQITFAIGVYVSGDVYVAAPLSESNPCIQGLGVDGWVGSVSIPNIETSVAVPFVSTVLSGAYEQIGRFAVLWTDGWPAISNNGWGGTEYGAGVAWRVTYYSCGQAWVGPPPSEWVAWSAGVYLQNGTPRYGLAGSTGSFCTLMDYIVTFGKVVGGSGGSGFAYRSILNVSGSYHGMFGNQSNVSGAQGVAAWMVQPQVLTFGPSTATSADLCPDWTRNPRSCPLPGTGWYAILESPNGEWLDSYGLVNGSPNWTAPNAPIVSGESLVILSANSLAGSNDTLSMESTVSDPLIQGTHVHF